MLGYMLVVSVSGARSSVEDLRVAGDRRLLSPHQSGDNADGEDHQADGVTHLDVIEGAELNHGESKTCK